MFKLQFLFDRPELRVLGRSLTFDITCLESYLRSVGNLHATGGLIGDEAGKEGIMDGFATV